MKKTFSILIILSFTILSCVSIPKQTVILSKTLGNDLEVLHNSHRNMANIYFEEIKNNINTFVDEVYSPFVIHYVLKAELKKSKNGNESLYSAIEQAGKTGGKKEIDEALNVMQEFQEAALAQIKFKRNELLAPILIQEREVLGSINQSYENAVYANATVTGYLESVRKVKEAQKEALALVGLKDADVKMISTLLKISHGVNDAIEIGKKIDLESDDAYEQLEKVSNQIKNLTTKN
jgi:hypothetical protein